MFTPKWEILSGQNPFNSMAVSIVKVLRKDKVNSKMFTPINIRLILNRKTIYVPTGISIPMDMWDHAHNEPITSYKEGAKIALKLDEMVLDIEKRIQQLEVLEMPITLEALTKKRKPVSNISVAEYMEDLCKSLKKANRLSSAQNYKSCLASLSQYRPMDRVRFGDISPQFIKGYEQFLRAKGCTNNGIASRMRLLKATYNRASAEKVFLSDENPFEHYKVGALLTPTRKRAIDKEQIRKIEAFDATNSYSPYTQLAKDLFLFSYYSAGINLRDIALLKWGNIVDGRIYYTRHKTGKRLNCRLTPQTSAIVAKHRTAKSKPEDYIFPILDRRIHKTEVQQHNRINKVQRHINRELHAIGREIGLLYPLTTYVARHTYATVMKRAGVNLALISETLGHSSLSTTQIYLDSFDNEQIDEAMKFLA